MVWHVRLPSVKQDLLPEVWEYDLQSASLEHVEPRRTVHWTRQHTGSIVIIAALCALGTAVFFSRGLLGEFEAYGYLGVLVLCMIASAVPWLPMPAAAMVFIMGAILNPWLVGLMVGIAEPVGEIGPYMAGYSGRVALQNRKLYKKLVAWMQRRGSLLLLCLSCVPNPAFMMVSVAAGALRYPLRKFLPVLFVGKTAKGLLVAFAGYWTLRLLLQFLLG